MLVYKAIQQLAKKGSKAAKFAAVAQATIKHFSGYYKSFSGNNRPNTNTITKVFKCCRSWYNGVFKCCEYLKN